MEDAKTVVEFSVSWFVSASVGYILSAFAIVFLGMNSPFSYFIGGLCPTVCHSINIYRLTKSLVNVFNYVRSIIWLHCLYNLSIHLFSKWDLLNVVSGIFLYIAIGLISLLIAFSASRKIL